MNATQECILSIFEEISKICKKHDIPYYAIGGTCIGAIRHQGFIPWDDDLDIAIPIEYFDYFFEVAQSELPKHLVIIDGKRNPQYGYVWNKIADDRTTFIEDWEMKDTRLYKGVFVDIMPISGVPEDGDKQKKFFAKLFQNINLNTWQKVPPRCSASLKSQIFKTIVHCVLSVFPNDYFYDRAMNQMRAYPLEESNKTGYTWHTYGGRTLVFDSVWFRKAVELPFETTGISCPEGYHEMLKYQFGDYMKLPPEDKRVSCHNPMIDLNKSHFEYRKQNDKGAR